jgi:hypothetical protein
MIDFYLKLVLLKYQILVVCLTEYIFGITVTVSELR